MIAAVILAAGLSKRMGRPKMALPWGNMTVLGQVVSVLAQAKVDEIIVVTGAARPQVEALLTGLPARPVFNPRFEEDHMLLSLQTGLAALNEKAEAALVTLGDQPRIEASVVQAVLATYRQAPEDLIVPSYQMRRGHPWLIARPLWREVFALQPPATLREFLNQRAGQIKYLPVQTDSILSDLDTPADYEHQRPDLS